MRQLAIIIWCALAGLTACGVATIPPTPTAADRQTQLAQLTQVAGHLAATAERRATERAATAAAATLPTPTRAITPTATRPVSQAPVAIGSAAANLADFRLTAYQGDASLGGRDSRLSNAFTYGLPVVVNFWAPLCPPCRAEMPAFQRVSDEFAGQVFFLGVDLSPYASGFGGQAEALQLIRDTGIHYPVAYATDDPSENYRIRTIPITVFFTADGKVFKSINGSFSEPVLRRTVQELLAAPIGQP